MKRSTRVESPWPVADDEYLVLGDVNGVDVGVEQLDDAPRWLWIRLRVADEQREVWERVFADGARNDALDYRAATAPTPEGDTRQLRTVRGEAAHLLPVETAAPAEIMTVEETAALLRINVKTAYEKIRRGEIPGGKYIGGAVRISRQALLDAFRQPGPLTQRRRR